MSPALPDPEAEPLRSPRTPPDVDVPLHRGDRGSVVESTGFQLEIEVTVLDQNGQPVEAAEVSLAPLPGAENDTLLLLGSGSFVEGWTQLTNKNGEVRFELRAEFDGVLSVRCAGMEPSAEYPVRAGDGMVLSLEPREEAREALGQSNGKVKPSVSPVFDAENALAPRAWVEGTLMDYEGRPLVNALVTQLTAGKDGTLPGSLTLIAARLLPHSRTDDRGRFMLPLASIDASATDSAPSVHLAAFAWPHPVAVRTLSHDEYASEDAPSVLWQLEEGYTVDLRGAPAYRSVLVEEFEGIDASRLVVRRRLVRSAANGKLSISRVREGALRVSIPGVETMDFQVGDQLT